MNDDAHEDRCDVAVIGAGIAGLSAAIEAARGGAVRLLDARRDIGGRARTRHRSGYSLNEGAHALYVDGAAMAFLRELGREPTGGVPDAGAGIGVDGELEGVFPVSAHSLLRTSLLEGDRLRMARLLAVLPRMRPGRFADRSVDTLIRERLGSGRAARLGHALFRLGTYGNDPVRTSADAGLTQLQMSLRGGVLYLDGGWQQMVDTLATANRDRGVEIRPGSKVTSVRTEGSDHVVVHTGGELRARRVIVAGSPALAAELLGAAVPDVRTWAEDARPAAVASLDVGFPDPWSGLRPFALGIDTPTYLSVHAPVADLAPDGHTLVHVMRYLPNDEEPDRDRDRAECEALLERVRPGWRHAADHVSFSPHLVAATDQPSAARGGLVARPSVSVPGAPGRFVAGDWVGPTGTLVDASVASGRAAGRAAIV
ncbi:MAG: FAD-dependent oxidoreductase [Acidimicrobiales bacterium]